MMTKRIKLTIRYTIKSIPLILHTTLVLFLINILFFPIRSYHFQSPAILIPVNSVASILTLILKHLVPSLSLLSSPNLTTVTFCITIFRRLKI